MHEQRALAGLLAAVGHRLVEQNVLERHLRHPQPGHRAWGYLNYILMPTLDVWRRIQLRHGKYAFVGFVAFAAVVM